MAAILLAAKCLAVLGCERQARNNGNAVIALLAKFGDVGVAQIMQGAGGKLALRAFGFLKAKHIGLELVQNPLNQTDAQADRIDIPGGDLECHGRRMSIGSRCQAQVPSAV